MYLCGCVRVGSPEGVGGVATQTGRERETSIEVVITIPGVIFDLALFLCFCCCVVI